MKNLILLFLLLPALSSVFGQDYSGLWVGVLRSDMGKQSQYYKFFLQLNQSGKAVWGVYTSGNGDSASDINKANCSCLVSSINGNKKEMHLYRDKVIRHSIPLSTCEALVFFSMRQSNLHDTIFLKGTWTGVFRSIYRKDDASGEISLVKISDAQSEYINQYFPDLEKWIKKVNKGELKDSHTMKKIEPVKTDHTKDTIQPIKQIPIKKFNP